MGQALGPLDNPEKNPVSRDLQLPTSQMRSLTYIHPSSLENLLLASGMPEAIGTQEESHAWAGTSLNLSFWVGFKLCGRFDPVPKRPGAGQNHRVFPWSWDWRQEPAKHGRGWSQMLTPRWSLEVAVGASRPGLAAVVRATRSSGQGFHRRSSPIQMSHPRLFWLLLALYSYIHAEILLPNSWGSSWIQAKALPPPFFPVSTDSQSSPILEPHWQRACAN